LGKVIAAIDLLVAPILTFERLLAFLVLGHDRQQLLWFELTRRPPSEWLARQITEAFPWASAPASAARLPTIYETRRYPEAGGLMCYGPDISDLFRRAAIYVDRLLQGAKPADLPVEQPTKFELVINLATAKALGLTIPDRLLALADDVID
jgi:hypothetical protein